MERVLGHICRNALPAGYADEPEQRRAIGEGLVDTLAALHTVDPAAVGLAEFGRPAGFMERQLRRWSKQWEATKVAELPALDALRDDLLRELPPEREHAIVHGDYRLDNTILHPTQPGSDRRRPRLGDEHARRSVHRLRRAPGVLERGRRPRGAARRADRGAGHGRAGASRRAAEVIERYARQTGFDVSDADWYQAFALFKLAVVCQGIAARHAGGAMVGSGFDDAQRLVAPLVEAGRYMLAAHSRAA